MAEGKIVKRKDMVTVYGTGASKFMAQGKQYKVHAHAGEKLIARGFAATSPQDGKQDGKKGKKE